ncbi:hypothetical protein [Bacillus niameyensis]|uniref:hypothetical protein n=1 Tax=Bacillus niameyensis TaxID=1522308 RepID=UPI000785CF9A|nr:hypothetical protein [Bacillus niameyensis]
MKVGKAKKIAVEWVVLHVSQKPWFRGAYFSGSTTGMQVDEELPISSDIDIVIVTDEEEVPLKLGKLIYKGVLIEITYIAWKELQSAEHVLTAYHLAGSFRLDTIIVDPTGHLHKLQKEVSSQFSKRSWVRRRCENARKKVENGLQSIDPAVPWHDQVTSWLFPSGVTTHVILVAALRNPTVRLRYLAAREVLMEYGYTDIYEELLTLLGCVQFTPQQVENHLEQLALTFDAAASVAKTPFFFSTDIAQISRPIAIDGSLNLIRSGYHREAMFWIIATFARCHKILACDAPNLQLDHTPTFEAVMSDIGVYSTNDLILRGEHVIDFLPKLWNTTEAILNENPYILNG